MHSHMGFIATFAQKHRAIQDIRQRLRAAPQLADCKGQKYQFGYFARCRRLPAVGAEGIQQRHAHCKFIALKPRRKRNQMMDAVFVLATLLFFTAAWAYARGCENI